MAKRPKQAKTGLTRKQASRAQKETRLQRTVLIGTGIVIVAVIGLIAFAIINESVIKPRQVVVSVGDQKITAEQFEEQMLVDFFFQTGGQSLAELGVDAVTVAQYLMENMIDELVILQKAADLGISVSDDEVLEQVQLAFGYDAGDPEPTLTPRPTQDTSIEPTVTPTFVYTLTPFPTATLEPGVTPTPISEPTPTPSEPPTEVPATAPPTEGPTAEPLPTATPITEESFNEGFDDYLTFVAEQIGLDNDRVRELLLRRSRIAMLREQIFEDIDLPVADTKEMVHVGHILVETEEEALAIIERLNAGEEFEQLAADLSIGPSGPQGGNLGWLSRGDTVEPFNTTAFELPVGEISEPILTEFGWHVIKKYDEDLAVQLTDAEREQLLSDAFNDMLVQWRSELEVEIADNWQNHIPELP